MSCHTSWPHTAVSAVRCSCGMLSWEMIIIILVRDGHWYEDDRGDGDHGFWLLTVTMNIRAEVRSL
jgi:hypothetical protein